MKGDSDPTPDSAAAVLAPSTGSAGDSQIPAAVQANEQHAQSGQPLQVQPQFRTHGQVRRRRSGNFFRSLTVGSLVVMQSTRASARKPTRRLRCLRHSRLRPLTPRARTHHRHPRMPSQWHSELLQAHIRRLPSRPTQRAPSRFAVPGRSRYPTPFTSPSMPTTAPAPTPAPAPSAAPTVHYRTHRHLAAPPTNAPPQCG